MEETEFNCNIFNSLNTNILFNFYQKSDESSCEEDILSTFEFLFLLQGTKLVFITWMIVTGNPWVFQRNLHPYSD